MSAAGTLEFLRRLGSGRVKVQVGAQNPLLLSPAVWICGCGFGGSAHAAHPPPRLAHPSAAGGCLCSHVPGPVWRRPVRGREAWAPLSGAPPKLRPRVHRVSMNGTASERAPGFQPREVLSETQRDQYIHISPEEGPQGSTWFGAQGVHAWPGVDRPRGVHGTDPSSCFPQERWQG